MFQLAHKKRQLMFAFIILVAFLTVSCDKAPIKIGFIGSLTSRQSQLSIDARNAVEIGIEKINDEGGIEGRPIKLVVKDDHGDYNVSLEKYKEFIDEGVQFIIGPMTSNLSNAILDAPKSEVLFISPSISSNILSEIDDNFLRISPLIDAQSETFLKFIDSKKYKHLTIIYDSSNKEYTEYLSKLIKKDGQSIIDTIDLIPFDSEKDNLETSFSEIDMKKTEGILMISQATDTAFIAQRINQENKTLDLYSVSWSMTKDLIRYGGKTVERMHLIGIYKLDEPSSTYLSFDNAFYEKFSYEPSFISILTYDTFNVLIEGMIASDELSVANVKETILSIEKFPGLEDPIVMDQYGDSKRNYLMYEVINGKFVPKY